MRQALAASPACLWLLHRPAACYKEGGALRRSSARVPHNGSQILTLKETAMDEQLRQQALEYHRLPTAGKISVTPTKSLVNQHDLALA